MDDNPDHDFNARIPEAPEIERAQQTEEAAGQEPLDLSPREEFINKVLGDLARDELGQRTVGDAVIAAFGEGVTEEFIGGLADMLLEYQAQCIVTGSDARSSTLQIFMRGMELGRGLVEASAS
jgi:hypothetical protein